MKEMTTSVKPQLPAGMPDETRVWIYQCDRELTPEEDEKVKALTRDFIEGWAAHNVKLKAAGEVYFRRFVCLFADESAAGASGCSIDSSVRFVQGLERMLGTSLTNRFQMTYLDGDAVKSVHLNSMPESYASGAITGETLVFNNLAATLGDMKANWPMPLKDSWHMKFTK